MVGAGAKLREGTMQTNKGEVWTNAGSVELSHRHGLVVVSFPLSSAIWSMQMQSISTGAHNGLLVLYVNVTNLFSRTAIYAT
jgi:hypothetical protein